MILFGLFHGLILLPIVLALIGPMRKKAETKTDQSEGNAEELEEMTNQKAANNDINSPS